LPNMCALTRTTGVKPEHMTFEQAAAIPQAGVLAVQALAAGGRSDLDKRF